MHPTYAYCKLYVLILINNSLRHQYRCHPDIRAMQLAPACARQRETFPWGASCSRHNTTFPSILGGIPHAGPQHQGLSWLCGQILPHSSSSVPFWFSPRSPHRGSWKVCTLSLTFTFFLSYFFFSVVFPPIIWFVNI